MSTKNETAERYIKTQVGSFCPFVESCPYLDESVCADCLRYYITFEKLSRCVSMANIPG